MSEEPMVTFVSSIDMAQCDLTVSRPKPAFRPKSKGHITGWSAQHSTLQRLGVSRVPSQTPPPLPAAPPSSRPRCV
ncbi:hypothetical protein RRG08_027851 [Elysia crispata]|uniref:Uncharacterized protein n=1 Tax=Elysia crispata TaxID=231223 RepID=A0AAE0YTM3_9GAST|nr:hypothetical protein RRG08_027851 [Elysia crispata]